MPPAPCTRAAVARAMLALGFSTMLAQILLLRETAVWLRGNECVIAFVVAAWLLWIAVGSLVGNRVAAHAAWRFSRMAITGAALAACGTLVGLRCFWTCTGALPGEALDLARAAGLAVVVTCLPCLLSGSAFGAAVRACAAMPTDANQPRSNVARLYVFETLGATAAGLIATALLIPLMHWWLTLLLVVAPLCLVWRSRVLIACCALAVACAGWYSPALDAWAQRGASRFLTGAIVCDLDTPRERLTVTHRGDEYAFFSNGRLLGASVQRELAEEIGGYARLSAVRPRRALLIGFPYNGLLREFVNAGLCVSVLDPQAAWLPRLTPFLLPDDRAALTSAAVRIIARVQNVGTPETYAVARLYSAEWFAMLTARLSTNGALLVVLPGSAGYVPADLARIIERTRLDIRAGMQACAPANAPASVEIIPGSATLLVARRDQQHALTDTAMVARLAAQHPTTNVIWFSAALLGDQLSSYRREMFANACAMAGVRHGSTDMRPAIYGDALVYAEARFGSTLHAVLTRLYHGATGVMVVGGVAVLLVVFAHVCRARAHRRRIALLAAMTAISLAGFLIEMTVLVRFTTGCGAAFYGVGLLFAAYMAGVALAAAGMQQLALRRHTRGAGLAMIMLLVAACVAGACPLPVNSAQIWLACAGVMLATGAVCGALFAWIAQQDVLAHWQSSGVYGADVLGAVIGALLFSCVLPPTCGFGAIPLLCAACALLPGALVGRAGRGA
ncbi:MAG: hypothetical protein NTV22_10135 [bacterium]|nr:hypothetical protein [bacterium]